jgi:hypothetical protein
VLVSSYGPVYSVLRNNGDQLYIADGVNERDYAYDLSGLKPIRIGVTSGMREADRGLIRERVAQLSAIYHFSPAH